MREPATSRALSEADAVAEKAPRHFITWGVMLFSGTLFVSAFLSFSVEPMIAKMILPILGGSAAVWNTCLVFFQAALLAGYAYAHAGSRVLKFRAQIVVHIVVLATAFAVLPLHLPKAWAPPYETTPVFWLLLLLTVAVGLPFFALSANAPILQIWFSRSGDPAHRDPYFLYVSSNAGSLAGLLTYPILIEPTLALVKQRMLWGGGYLVLVVLVLACGTRVWGTRGRSDSAAEGFDSTESDSGRPGVRQVLRWILLAAVPSSLTIGVTTLLSTDLPAIPILWVLPLSVYLLSFVFVFSVNPPIRHETVLRRLPFLLLAAIFPLATGLRFPLPITLLLDLATLFGVALFCHGELARSRPSVRYLTGFYLWISTGGVLGGIFTSILAPLLFRTVLEVPLALICAALLRPRTLNSRKPSEMLDVALPIVLAIGLYGLIWLMQAKGFKPGPLTNVAMFGIALEWCLSFSRRPLRFALGLVAILVGSQAYSAAYGNVLYTARSFFGVSRVSDDDKGQFRRLYHAGTIHGLQRINSAKATRPYGYYTVEGPMGQIATLVRPETKARVAIVGLGTGGLACYFRRPYELTYYEIDPLVENIARNPKFFTFLRDCNPETRVVIGDARLSLQSAADGAYDMIILDAFSGDSIPAHLMTREAMQLYLSKLAPHGVIVANISNVFLDVSPVAAGLARSSGLTALSRGDMKVSDAEIENGHFPSQWVVFARSVEDLGNLREDARWMGINPRSSFDLWTDDFSSIFRVIRWH